jgi:GT2 family glycosyltransferase
MDLNNPNKFEYAGAAGGYIDRLGYPYCRGRIFKELEEDDGQFDTDKKIFWASGACFFIRLQEFRSLGGFDTNFFAHQEEIDLCWRAFNEGFEIMSISTSKVYHLGGGTLRPSYQKSFLNFRNSLFLLYKNLPEKVFFRIFERMIWDGVAVFYFLIKLEFRSAVAVLHAHFSFYFHLFTKKIIRKKNVKKNKYFKLKSLPIQHFINNKSKFLQL